MGRNEHDGIDLGLRRCLEGLSDRAVPGLERRALGDWWLRAGLGATGRANSAWATGSPGCPLPEAIDEVTAWYTARNLRPMIMAYDGGDVDLVRELNRRDWVTGNEALVMVADIEPDGAGPVGPVIDGGGWSVGLSDGPCPASTMLMDDTERLTEVTATELPQRFAVVSESAGAVLGGGTATIGGEWCGLLAMKTVPEARRRGVARVVLEALMGAAADLGAKRAWLQVETRNSGAVALYRGMGFRAVHAYRYRAAPTGSPGR